MTTKNFPVTFTDLEGDSNLFASVYNMWDELTQMDSFMELDGCMFEVAGKKYEYNSTYFHYCYAMGSITEAQALEEMEKLYNESAARAEVRCTSVLQGWSDQAVAATVPAVMDYLCPAVVLAMSATELSEYMSVLAM